MTFIPAPPSDCSDCPRLSQFLADTRVKLPDYHNAPVPSFGPTDAELLIVGLAPGMHGANQTGRPFTGDYAGDLLYATLGKFGFATGTYAKRPDDGLQLTGCRVTNAVRCVPPQNKPETKEIATCRPYLTGELDLLPNLKAVLTLGLIAHKSTLAAIGLKQSYVPFTHGGKHEVGKPWKLFGSYHCSRYNTNTGRLTTEMFEAVFQGIRTHLDQA
ncbi:MAG: uracil-DNA glycosylase [Alphaproteobacteria bacterium]|nr:uracil-DNA glycosylase [Alphaproteobacteria bacterium SS10]MBV6634240.1 uracil-DNA glycosylase [Alphaproteobacteria bacterium SS10]